MLTVKDNRMSSKFPTVAGSRRMYWIGWAMSGLVLLFLFADSIAKLLRVPQVIQGTIGLGYPEYMVVPLGILLIVPAILYAIPRTAVLGAILVTGYLGGAIANHVRLESPLFSHDLFGVYVGVLTWGGLWFRDARLRALIPLRVL